ncbi:hypothetical protein COCCU_07525 [Corynebacterium occultum]|uniref:NfeD-like C-terminal domain-containing protein n=2 Tax=Corynebacterium occultum TaxID=2675219 RepID=A0A6B8WM34_9CORY|nr:hypothetical protein COCCU_07525 [Corynebacterium occultum]
MVGEFTLLMLGGGALAAAGVSLLGAPLWGATLTFALMSIGLMFFLRPALKRHFHSPLMLDTSTRALVGNQAEVLELVDGHSGQVRLDGSIWSARSMDPSHSFAVGERVTVISIDGATAVVWKED